MNARKSHFMAGVHPLGNGIGLANRRWVLLAGLVLGLLLCRSSLLDWLCGKPCYRGRPCSYWRDQLRDWEIDSVFDRPEMPEEQARKKGEERKGVRSYMWSVSDYDNGQWCLLHRDTVGQARYRKLRLVLNRLRNRMAGTNVGISLNPTYGEPFCKLKILEGDPAAVPVLTALLKDSDFRIRRLAAATLRRIGPRAKTALPALLGTANRDTDPFLRGIARVAALQIDKEAAEKAGISQGFVFWSPQPKLRATIQGRVFLDSPTRFLADGKILAWKELDRTIKTCELATGKELASLAGPTDIGSAFAFSPDGKALASASQDKKTVYLWELASGRRLVALRGNLDGCSCLAFSPDGKTLASGSNDGLVTLWDVAAAKERVSLQGHAGGIHFLAFSPDGRTLASGSGDCSVKLWDVPTGKERNTLQHQPTWGSVRCLAFSPDGKVLASGSNDWTLKLWDAATGEERATLQGYDDEANVDSVAFSPDGQTMASVQCDTIFLWDVATGKNTAKILGEPAPVDGVGFTPDGRMLALGLNDGAVRLWEFAPAPNGKE